LQAIKKYRPVDATTNPSFTAKAAEMPHNKTHLEQAFSVGKQQSSDSEAANH